MPLYIIFFLGPWGPLGTRPSACLPARKIWINRYRSSQEHCQLIEPHILRKLTTPTIHWPLGDQLVTQAPALKGILFWYGIFAKSWYAGICQGPAGQHLVTWNDPLSISNTFLIQFGLKGQKAFGKMAEDLAVWYYSPSPLWWYIMIMLNFDRSIYCNQRLFKICSHL